MAADYERVMAAVKDFLHEQVRDGTLGGKEHRKVCTYTVCLPVRQLGRSGLVGRSIGLLARRLLLE